MAKPEDSKRKAADAATSASNDVKANEASAAAEAQNSAQERTHESKAEQAASSDAPEAPTVKSGALDHSSASSEFSAGERFTLG